MGDIAYQAMGLFIFFSQFSMGVKLLSEIKISGQFTDAFLSLKNSFRRT